VRAHLIDLSEAALVHSVQTLAAIEGLDISVTTDQATYEDGLLGLPPADGSPTLVAFLGSNIGNFDPPGAASFLGLIRACFARTISCCSVRTWSRPESELLARVRRSAGPDRRLQQESAAAAQQRAEGRLRPGRLCAPRRLES
jgi:hypothetical protein